MQFPQKSRNSHLWLATATMGSGIGLVIAVMANVSLGLMLLLFGLFAVLTFRLKWSRASSHQRRDIKNRIKVGLIAGLLATLAYDLSRLLVVTLFKLPVSPFEAFALFGQLIAGENISLTTAYIVGTIYHVFNGVFFTIAYCLAFGKRHWLFGVLWAFGLEVSMLLLYPSWLGLEGVMQEFTIMSITGHFAYGYVLGRLSQQWLTGKTS